MLYLYRIPITGSGGNRQQFFCHRPQIQNRAVCESDRPIFIINKMSRYIPSFFCPQGGVTQLAYFHTERRRKQALCAASWRVAAFSSVTAVCFSRSLSGRMFSGERGIRTPGASQLNGFQDRRNRPLCHLSGHKNSTVFPFRQISGAIISLQLSPEWHSGRQFSGPGFLFRAKNPIFVLSDR